MIQLEVTICNCCDEPADKCQTVIRLVGLGVPEELITHEVLYPEEGDVNDPGVYVGGTERTG